MTTTQPDLPLTGELDATKQAMADDPTVIDADGREWHPTDPPKEKPKQPSKPADDFSKLVQRTPREKQFVNMVLANIKPTVAEITGQDLSSPEFKGWILGIENAFANNPDLYNCSDQTIVRAIKEYAASGVRLGGGAVADCYFVPRKSHCCFQLSYGGMLKVAKQAGVIERHICRAVHDGDDFDYQDDLEPWVKHKQNGPDREKYETVTHVYAMFKLVGGDRYLVVMTKAEVEDLRQKFVKTSGADTPWKKTPIAMAKKSCVRQPFLRRELVLPDAHQAIIEADVIADQALEPTEPQRSKVDEL